MNQLAIKLSALSLVFALHSTGFSCAVPVFRYALENWEPDPLTVAIIHNGELSSDHTALIEKLEAAARENENSVNIRLHPIDVTEEHLAGSAEAHHTTQWKSKPLPHMLVYFSNDAPQPELAWSTPFTDSAVSNLLESPARQAVVERLLDGQSAAWALLTTGNKEADELAEQELRKELAKQQEEIELPSLTELSTEEKFDEDLPVEMRVEFSVVKVAPDDPHEAFFREMLLNTESDLREFNDPIAIPIYGRGRTYFALVGPGITSDNIADNCRFICGACSCEVKRDNPGQDLLLAANWNRVQPGNWVNDTPLPELTGIGAFEAIVDAGDADSGAFSADTGAHSLNDAGQSPTQLASASTSDAHLDEGAASTDGSKLPSSTTPSSTTFAPVVLLWGAVLFGIGLVFTVWQRSQSNE